MCNNYLIKIQHTLYFLIALLLLNCSGIETNVNEIPITTNSDEALELYLEGRELLEKGKPSQAAKLLEEAVALDSNFAKAYIDLALFADDYSKNRTNLSKAAELVDEVSEGEKYEMLFLLGYIDNDGVKQLEYLNKLLELYPNDKRVQNSAGTHYHYLTQEYNKALIHLKTAVELDSNYAPTYNNLGYLYDDLNNFNEAEKAFQKYIELIPDEANPYDSYAEFLLKRGKYEESIKQYNKAHETDSDFVTALRGIGNNYIFLEEFEKARDYYNQYYENSPYQYSKANALLDKAVSYIYEGRITEVKEAFEERAIFAKENDLPTVVVNSYLYAAWPLDEFGKFDEAEEYYNKSDAFIESSDMLKTDKIRFKVLAGIFRCHHNIKKNDLKTAEQAYEECRKLIEERQAPREIQYHNLLMGLMQIRKHDYQNAITYLEDANKKSPYVWYNQALAYEKIGNIEEARKLFSKVATCNENSLGLAIVRNVAKEKIMKL